MGRHTVFRLWEAELSSSLCQLIIDECMPGEFTQAALNPDSGEKYVDESIRKTEVSFQDATHWINGITSHYAQRANQEIWNYDISLSQGVQFACYRNGGTYDWHKDEFDQPFGDEAPELWQGMSRKLSVVVNLSDPDDYEGGQLLFKDTYGFEMKDEQFNQKISKRGSVVVFPSYIPHTVTPIESGERYSMATWVLGTPFR